MKYLLSYRAEGDFLPLARANREAHLARMKEFVDRGELLMAGPLDEPFNGDALSIFTTREAAVAFAESDPFVVNGVVSSWDIRPWSEVWVPETDPSASDPSDPAV